MDQDTLSRGQNRYFNRGWLNRTYRQFGNNKAGFHPEYGGVAYGVRLNESEFPSATPPDATPPDATPPDATPPNCPYQEDLPFLTGLSSALAISLVDSTDNTQQQGGRPCSYRYNIKSYLDLLKRCYQPTTSLRYTRLGQKFMQPRHRLNE